MSKDAYERGLKMRRKVLGDAWVDQALASRTAFNEEFQELITRYAWDEIWNRPGLEHPVRRMLVIAMTVAQGKWEEFRLHVQAALASGDLSPDDVKEVLLQSAIYCGVPAANTAFREARDIVAAHVKGARKPRAAKKAKKKSKKR